WQPIITPDLAMLRATGTFSVPQPARLREGRDHIGSRPSQLASKLLRTCGRAAVQRWTAARRGKTDSLGRLQLDASVLRTAFVGIVGRDEVGLAEAARDQARLWNALLFEVLRHGVGAALR